MSKLPEGRKPLPNEWFIDRANMMEKPMIQYAVMIDVDGDWMYVPENTHGFLNHPAILNSLSCSVRIKSND